MVRFVPLGREEGGMWLTRSRMYSWQLAQKKCRTKITMCFVYAGSWLMLEKVCKVPDASYTGSSAIDERTGAEGMVYCISGSGALDDAGASHPHDEPVCAPLPFSPAVVEACGFVGSAETGS